MAELRLEDAVPLGYALCHRVAVDSGIRTLWIKGPVRAWHGLPTSTNSIDIDILVDPLAVRHFVSALEQLGWQKHDHGGAFILPPHSDTLTHPRWPCEIDVHNRFPGFLADPEVSFEALWRRRTEIQVAGATGVAVDLAGAILVDALHYLRDPDRRSAELQSLERHVAGLRASEWRVHLARLATEAGADVTADPFLRAVRVDLPTVGPTAVNSGRLTGWQLRTRSGGVRSVAGLRELREASWRQRPKVLAKLVWLPRDVVLAQNPEYVNTWFGVVRAQMARWREGARSLPQAIRLLGRSHR